jgi:hypothetical protein
MVTDISNSMTDEKKLKIDEDGRSMVIISHPLQRLVNGWHHKFHRTGIHQAIGQKLIWKLNLTDLVDNTNTEKRFMKCFNIKFIYFSKTNSARKFSKTIKDIDYISKIS